MSYAGHVLEVIQRQKLNRNLQKLAKQRYRDKLKSIQESSSTSNKTFNYKLFPNIAEVEKIRIRKKVKKQMRKETQIVYIKALISILLMTLMLYLIMF